jgi:predicted ATPase
MVAPAASRAAEWARDRHAYEQALVLYTRALALMGEDDERRRNFAVRRAIALPAAAAHRDRLGGAQLAGGRHSRADVGRRHVVRDLGDPRDGVTLNAPACSRMTSSDGAS